MEYTPRPVSRMTVILFPILLTVIAAIFLPEAAPLISTLMLGNLIKESGVVDGLVDTAKDAITNTCTIFLGLAIGSTMQAATFLNTGTLRVLVLGLLAFALNTIGGLMFGKLVCVLSGRKINPLVGAAAISAFPMSGRLAQKVALETDNNNSSSCTPSCQCSRSGCFGSAAGILMQMIFPILIH